MFVNLLLLLLVGGMIYAVVWYVRRVFLKEKELAAIRFRETALRLLGGPARNDFNFSVVVRQTGVSLDEAIKVARSIYQEYYLRAIADGEISDKERRLLRKLGSVLEISNKSLTSFEKRANSERYRQQLREALKYGGLTNTEIRDLEKLRVSLTLSRNDLANMWLDGGNGLEAIKEYFRERFYEAKQDGHISKAEERQLEWIIAVSGLSKDEVLPSEFEDESFGDEFEDDAPPDFEEESETLGFNVEPETKGNRETRPCPFCAEPIRVEAIKCRFCGEFLEKAARSRPHTNNRQVEFRTQNEYDRWLRDRGSRVRIINVNTTPRWSLWTGFMGGAKVYTVTYEEGSV